MITASNTISLIFRSSPNYEIVDMDSPKARLYSSIHDQLSLPDAYGVIYPIDSSSSTRARVVCCSTALLLYSLRKPGPLPYHVNTQLSNTLIEQIVRLVLDGVLEVKDGSAFISGPQATKLFFLNAGISGMSDVSKLSESALQCAQALNTPNRVNIEYKLYNYNRLLLSAHWNRTMDRAGGVDRFLSVEPGGANEPERTRWLRTVDDQNRHWMYWTAPQAFRLDKKRGLLHEGPTCYKLYISPSCDALKEVFKAIVSILSESQAVSFKIGSGVHGLLRPDKMVAYFRSHNDLTRAASQLSVELRGCPSHGVPFTAKVLEHGSYISWGIDPTFDQRGASLSWRQWLCRRLADAIASAQELNCEIEPWRYAMERLYVEGVDTTSWTPRSTIWDCSLYNKVNNDA